MRVPDPPERQPPIAIARSCPRCCRGWVPGFLEEQPCSGIIPEVPCAPGYFQLGRESPWSDLNLQSAPPVNLRLPLCGTLNGKASSLLIQHRPLGIRPDFREKGAIPATDNLRKSFLPTSLIPHPPSRRIGEIETRSPFLKPWLRGGQGPPLHSASLLHNVAGTCPLSL